ncbi:hypothetical protein GYMLUDRAFT_87788 [Collybiopsis luxurians FD-317 M1]|uniref:Uncharacterized protein n=1 Tax=Collybiopsis luxurians FD-317 M1 TaxID=944289 RepID=A0A0D0CAW7_9AGAR|nr:hypothetical protein GYMLUDRAFT_87788 [Collybiopsis luxurians FD-317 M1]
MPLHEPKITSSNRSRSNSYRPPAPHSSSQTSDSQLGMKEATSHQSPHSGGPVLPTVRFIEPASASPNPFPAPLSSIPPHLRSAKQRTPTPYPMHEELSAESADEACSQSSVPRHLNHARIPTPHPLNGASSLDNLPPGLTVPLSSHPTKQRIPTPYPTVNTVDFDDESGEVVFETANVSSLRPRPGLKRSNLSDSVTVEPACEELEESGSTVRPKKKPKKMYSGLQDSPELSYSPAVRFGVEPTAGDSVDRFQFGSVSANASQESSGNEHDSSYGHHTLRPNLSDKLFSQTEVDTASAAKAGSQHADHMLRDSVIPEREPDTVPTIPSELSSRSGSVSPPASLDIFNPFEDPSEDVESSDESSSFYSFRRTSSLSSSSTVLSDTSPSPKKWEEAFDPDFVRSSSPSADLSSLATRLSSLDEAVARMASSEIGLGLPSTTLVTLGSKEGTVSRVRRDVLGHDSLQDEDRVSQIILNGPELRNGSPAVRMPSWDFGDGSEEDEDASLSVWGKMKSWVKEAECRDYINLAMGGGALTFMCFTLYKYFHRR